MAIKMRTGKEAELDISKAIPGEWLVSTDTRYVRMCFAPGIVLRMATYDAFEADTQKFIQQMESILSETKTVQEAVDRIQSEIEDSVVTVENYVKSAKGYSDLSNTYALQSKQYAEESSGYADDAYEEAERAKMYANNASAVTGVEIATQDRAGLMRGGDNLIGEDGELILTKHTTDTTLSNSHSGGVKINRIAGAVGQKQYVGKNLLPYPYSETTHAERGIDWTDVGNGEVIANGTNTSVYNSWMTCAIQDTLWLKAGSYIVSGCPAGGSTNTYYMRVTTNEDTNDVLASDTGSGATFTLEQDCFVCVGCLIARDATVENVIFKPMIRKADIEDSVWEPYVGGTASPNPDYPQDIQNADFTEVKTVGKNMIPYPYYRGKSYTNNGITYDVDSNGVFTLNGTSTALSGYSLIATKDFIPLEDGETYTMWCNRINDDGATLFFRHYYMDSEGNVTSGNHTVGSVWRMVGSESIRKLGIAVGVHNVGETCNNAKMQVMIVKGKYFFEDLTYYPPKSSTASIAFTGRAVEVDADVDYTYEKDGKYYVADTIDRVDGGYEYHQRVLRFEFDGTEGWNSSTTNTGTTYRMIYKNDNIPSYPDLGVSTWKKVLACTHMQQCLSSSSQPYNEGETIALHNSSHYIQLYSAKYQDIDSWKAFLAEQYANGTPFTVDVRIAEPIITMISDEEAIALMSLKSFDEVTHLSSDSELQPIIESEYGTSKVGSYTLEALNTAQRNEIQYASLATLTNSLATALVAGSEE